MENIFFTSDCHFMHKNILKFCPNTRQGKDHEEMTEILITNWNRDVRDHDRVYILGDVFFCGAQEARSILRRLKGQKHLIYGNHDKVIQSNADIRGMFESVQDYKEINIGKQKVGMFHYPQLEWNRCHHGQIQLFGHVHGSMDNHPHVSKYKTMDVGVDSRPLGVEPDNGIMSLWAWEQIEQIMSKRERLEHH